MFREGCTDGYPRCSSGARPRLHDRRRRRPDQPARHPPDAGRGPRWSGSSPGWASRPPTRTYGAIAAFGLTADHRPPRRLASGPWARRRVFLLWLAWRTFRGPAGDAAVDVTSGGAGLPGAYLCTLGLTLTNPMTILSFAALFVGLGVTGRRCRRRDVADARRVRRVGRVVGRADHGRRGVPIAAHADRHAPGQHRVGRAHRRVRARRDRVEPGVRQRGSDERAGQRQEREQDQPDADSARQPSSARAGTSPGSSRRSGRPSRSGCRTPPRTSAA